jgi:hypothetical protein
VLAVHEPGKIVDDAIVGIDITCIEHIVIGVCFQVLYGRVLVPKHVYEPKGKVLPFIGNEIVRPPAKTDGGGNGGITRFFRKMEGGGPEGITGNEEVAILMVFPVTEAPVPHQCFLLCGKRGGKIKYKGPFQKRFVMDAHSRGKTVINIETDYRDIEYLVVVGVFRILKKLEL